MAFLVFKLAVAASLPFPAALACEISALGNCQTAFEDATKGSTSENSVDCNTIVPALQTYQTCALDAVDGCFEGLVTESRNYLDRQRTHYAEFCSEINMGLKKIFECKPKDITQIIAQCQEGLQPMLQAVEKVVDCADAQSSMVTYKSCVEEKINSTVNASECSLLVNPIFDEIRNQESRFTAHCMEMKPMIDDCKHNELITCLQDYMTVAETQVLTNVQQVDEAALCSAKDKLATCLDTVAPNCDVAVTRPSQTALIGARETSPDVVCWRDISNAYMRHTSIVSIAVLSFVQYLHA